MLRSLKWQIQKSTGCFFLLMTPGNNWQRIPTLRKSRQSCTAVHSPRSFTLSTSALTVTHMGPSFRTATTQLLKTSNSSFLCLFRGNCYKHLRWLPSLGAKTCLKPEVPGKTRANISDTAYKTQAHCARGQLCRIFHQHVWGDSPRGCISCTMGSFAAYSAVALHRSWL